MSDIVDQKKEDGRGDGAAKKEKRGDEERLRIKQEAWERRHALLDRYDTENITMKQLGDEEGITGNRVGQLIRRARWEIFRKKLSPMAKEALNED
jgi:YesN/AraC family two-component response regulator